MFFNNYRLLFNKEFRQKWHITILRAFYNDREHLKKAFSVQGQNGFETSWINFSVTQTEKIVRREGREVDDELHYLIYAISSYMIKVIEKWLIDDNADKTPEFIAKIFWDMMPDRLVPYLM